MAPENAACEPLWLRRARFLIDWIASAGVSGLYERWSTMTEPGPAASVRGQAGAAIVDLQLAHKAVDAAAGFIGAGVTDEQIAAARRALTDLQHALWPVAHGT